jgi:hypothetical protein
MLAIMGVRGFGLIADHNGNGGPAQMPGRRLL